MWLESKLIELGMVGDDSRGYKISFGIPCSSEIECGRPLTPETVLDRTPMFSVYSVRHGQSFKHEVKALEIIWKKVLGLAMPRWRTLTDPCSFPPFTIRPIRSTSTIWGGILH